MLEDINIEETATKSVEWAKALAMNDSMLIQLGLILSCFILAGFIYVVIRKKVQNAIDASSMPIRVKRIATNLRKLIFPLNALLLLFITSAIAASESFGINVSLSIGVQKVLMAWIFVRVAVQFIENNLVRNIFATIIWIILALSIFGVLEQTTNTLDGIGFSIGEFRLSALAVIKGIFSLFALLYIAIFASTFAERRILQIKSLNRSSQVLVAKVTRISLIVFALLVGVTSAGIDLSLFAVFGGAVGLGIGFGLQKVISNLFSGMLLLVDRSIKPGDVIEIPDIGTFGWVNNMAARYTEIVTRDNKSFLIPNEDFITQRVVNWSHGNSLIRLQVHFGVHYNSDPHLVKKLAEAAAAKPERVVNDPNPVCWMVEFGDSSLNFSLRFWIKDAEAGVTNIRGTVMMELWDAFKENGIQIPYPHREVYMHTAPDNPIEVQNQIKDEREKNPTKKTANEKKKAVKKK